jgi:hypothetical protein
VAGADGLDAAGGERAVDSVDGADRSLDAVGGLAVLGGGGDGFVSGSGSDKNGLSPCADAMEGTKIKIQYVE